MATDIFVFLYCVLLLVFFIPIATFSLQVLIAVLPSYKKTVIQPSDANIAILIPAHNEALGIEGTLNSIKAQATKKTRIVVIADNCNDHTADMVRASGLEVIERFDDNQRGKGFALDYGIKHLITSNPPDIVMVFDADCLIYDGTINALAQAVTSRKCAIQALYLIQSKPDANIKFKLAEFAYVVKSLTRPLGFHRLGLPMQLMGSGMAFPWEQLKDANLTHGSIVEDMKLGIDLALKHKAPSFCPEAYVTSLFPEDDTGTDSQRKRWEHGHMSMIVQEGIPLLLKGLRSLNLSTIAMGLDLIVPPLALLFLLTLVFALFSITILIVTGRVNPFVYGVILFIIFSLSVLLAWIKHGRKILYITELIRYAPKYAFSKIKLYLTFFKSRQVEWVKSRKD